MVRRLLLKRPDRTIKHDIKVGATTFEFKSVSILTILILKIQWKVEDTRTESSKVEWGRRSRLHTKQFVYSFLYTVNKESLHHVWTISSIVSSWMYLTPKKIPVGHIGFQFKSLYTFPYKKFSVSPMKDLWRRNPF